MTARADFELTFIDEETVHFCINSEKAIGFFGDRHVEFSRETAPAFINSILASGYSFKFDTLAFSGTIGDFIHQHGGVL